MGVEYLGEAGKEQRSVWIGEPSACITGLTRTQEQVTGKWGLREDFAGSVSKTLCLLVPREERVQQHRWPWAGMAQHSR